LAASLLAVASTASYAGRWLGMQIVRNRVQLGFACKETPKA
jgi:hypothetical protein